MLNRDILGSDKTLDRCSLVWDGDDNERSQSILLRFRRLLCENQERKIAISSWKGQVI